MNRADEPACKILRHVAKGKRAAAKIGCRADCFRRSGDLAPEVQDEALLAEAANQKVATRPQYRNCLLPGGDYCFSELLRTSSPAFLLLPGNAYSNIRRAQDHTGMRSVVRLLKLTSNLELPCSVEVTRLNLVTHYRTCS